jgi:signal transduction histidine kinase
MREILVYLGNMPVPLVAGVAASVAGVVVLVCIVMQVARRQIELHEKLNWFLAQMGTYTRLEATINGAAEMIGRTNGAAFALLYLQDSPESALVLKARWPRNVLGDLPIYVDTPQWPKPRVGEVYTAQGCDLSLLDAASGSGAYSVLVTAITAWDRVMGYAIVGWRGKGIPAPSSRVCMGMGKYLGVLIERMWMYEALRGQAMHTERAVTDLRRQTVEQAEMLHDVLHDLRHPLGAAKGYLELALEEETTADESQLLRRAHGAMARAIELADGLLLADLPERERNEATPVVLRDVVQEVAEQVEASARTAELSLAVDVDGALPLVVGNRQYLYRVLMNLVLNGMQHTGPGGAVGVRAFEDDGGGGVAIQVSDTGQGLPNEDLQALLSAPLDQPPPAGRLGLRIVRKLVAAMGGHLCGESTPGQGTQFAFSLPVAEEVEAVRETRYG